MATDLAKGRSIALRKGDLVNAMIEVQLSRYVIHPYAARLMVLVDGGIMSNIPIETAAAEFHPTVIISSI